MLKSTLTSLTLGTLLATGVVAQSFSESASCQLTKIAENVVLYEGPCMVTQSDAGNNITKFAIKMGNAEPFLFAGQRGHSTWMHGPEEVQFTDAAAGGIFRWGDFVLAVAE